MKFHSGRKFTIQRAKQTQSIPDWCSGSRSLSRWDELFEVFAPFGGGGGNFPKGGELTSLSSSLIHDSSFRSTLPSLKLGNPDFFDRFPQKFARRGGQWIYRIKVMSRWNEIEKLLPIGLVIENFRALIRRLFLIPRRFRRADFRFRWDWLYDVTSDLPSVKIPNVSQRNQKQDMIMMIIPCESSPNWW
jgi:hypothetical protein